MVEPRFEDELSSLMRAPIAGSEPQALVAPIIARVEAESRRRAILLGAFGAGGAALTAATLVKAAGMGLSMLDLASLAAMPNLQVAGYIGAGLLVLVAGSGLAIRVSQAL